MSSTEILVIREKDRFSSILIEQGFKITNFPTIKTVRLENVSELENVLERIESYDGIFITSFKAAEIFLDKFQEKDRNFKGKFYVLGKKSGDLLKAAGFEIFYDENAATAEEMLKAIPQSEIKGRKFLFPRGTRSLRVISEKLKNIATVREVVVYETAATEIAKKQSDKIKEKLENKIFAAVCFFSPSGVEEFLKRFEDFYQNNIKIAAIGKTTAKYAREKRLRVDFVSDKPTAEDYAFGLIEYLRKEI